MVPAEKLFYYCGFNFMFVFYSISHFKIIKIAIVFNSIDNDRLLNILTVSFIMCVAWEFSPCWQSAGIGCRRWAQLLKKGKYDRILT